jgi:hypothetical protein
VLTKGELKSPRKIGRPLVRYSSRAAAGAGRDTGDTSEGRYLRFAYADPPYLGTSKARYSKHHPEAANWDDPETHRDLIAKLCDEFKDGWAMSLHVPSLKILLAMCPSDVRVAAHCKPFTAGIGKGRVQWMWDPVIWRGGRRINDDDMVRDWIVCWPRSGAKDGLVGGKPRAVCRWIFSLLGAESGDDLVDLFPGTGAVGAAWAEYIGKRCPLPELPLGLADFA